jgi:hypothetical protein
MFARRRSAARFAMPEVWSSSDSRIPFIRPSMMGRIPILGHSPTKRPEVLIVVAISLLPIVESRWGARFGRCDV